MPQTGIDISQLPNQLEAWIKPFEEIGVSAYLLKRTFSEISPDSFHKLYDHYSSLYPKPKGSLHDDSCLLLAALSGSLPAIQWVLEQSPELKASQDIYGTNWLHYAALSGSLPAIQWVLEQSPELKASQNKNGENWLHHAARSGSLPAIQWVLEQSPELKASQDIYGTNWLHHAAR